jgi:hypothetical protein
MATARYLQEKGQVAPRRFEQLRNELAAGVSGLRLTYLAMGVAASLTRVGRVEEPDRPQRIAAATVRHLGLPRIAKDRKIQVTAAAVVS